MPRLFTSEKWSAGFKRDFGRGNVKQKFYGILVRKERWGLSWRGRSVVLAFLLLFAWLIFFEIHPFLAVTHRQNARILVVEGWVHKYSINAAVKEFQTGNYDRVFVTGGPVVGTGGYINDYNTEASVGADLLKTAGIPNDFVQMVPSRVWNRNRTYYSAVALRDWFSRHDIQVRSMNVLTEEAHCPSHLSAISGSLRQKRASGHHLDSKSGL